MKTSEIRSALRRRWPVTLGVVALAVILAVLVHGRMTSSPTGQATTQILVDSPSSALVNVNVNSVGLTAQAAVLAQAMTSQAVLQQVAKAAGVPAGSVSAQGPFAGAGESLNVPTPSEARSMQVVAAGSAYHVAFVAQQDVPIITVTVLGPNPSAAGKVADSVLAGTEAWLKTIAATSTVKKGRQLVLRQLGDAQAGPVNSRSALILAVMAMIAVLLFGVLAVALLDRRLLDRKELRRHESELGELEQAFERERGSISNNGGDDAAGDHANDAGHESHDDELATAGASSTDKPGKRR